VIGHDWGAPVAWSTALLRPDRVRGVVGLSVPHRPRGPMSSLTAMRRRLGERFYQAYFQQPGIADTELARDVRSTILRIMFTLSGDGPQDSTERMMSVPAAGLVAGFDAPPTLPAWLTDDDLAAYTADFERTGFTGGLNWYRNIDRSWELMAPWQGATVMPPALYMVGDRDLVFNFPGMQQAVPHLKAFIPNLVETIVLPGCGHWTQQERPAEVNAALLQFLHQLPS
jgi:pimeloyl-ACP methyl ester carboxylesterase